MSKVIFSVDLEDWNHALHTDPDDHTSLESAYFLLDILAKYEVRAIFYVLGRFSEENKTFMKKLFESSHVMGSHGAFHDHNEASSNPLFRSPYWDTTPLPGLCGGFFFRLLPLPILIQEVRRCRMFYIHPHDLDESHPKLRNPLLNWKRHVGLSNARNKLDTLLQEVEFGEPSTN